MATLSQNVAQAISDFSSIKTAIENKGVTIPSGTATAQYPTFISEIDDNTKFRKLIDGSIETAVIPDGITLIKDYSFYWRDYLTSVTIPNTVTKIGAHAFDSCYQLNNVIVPHGVTFLDVGCFYGCNHLTTISLPNTITIFGNQAFRGCTALANITMENGWNSDAQFNYSNGITVESLVGILNALFDRTAQSAKTITIGSTNLNKLTAEQIAVATNKNWNLA